MNTKAKKTKLIILDIDNTMFDWMSYYIPAFKAELEHVEKITGIPYDTLCKESQDIFARHGSTEYPFVIQQLPSVLKYYNNDMDKMMNECVEPARQTFNYAAYPNLKPYPTVIKTLQELRQKHKDVPIVAFTDAPKYVAMWRCSKIGILHFFDAIYGLEDPKLPTHNGHILVNREILLKHVEHHKFGFVGTVRELPDEYEKPGVKGLKTILLDYELEEKRDQVLYVGDNLLKDIGLGKKLNVKTAWAKYGVSFNKDLIDILYDFSPPQFVTKNQSVTQGASKAPPKPDHEIDDFSEILNLI